MKLKMEMEMKMKMKMKKVETEGEAGVKVNIKTETPPNSTFSSKWMKSIRRFWASLMGQSKPFPLLPHHLHEFNRIEK